MRNTASKAIKCLLVMIILLSLSADMKNSKGENIVNSATLNDEWNRTFGGGDDDWAYFVQQTNDGGYVLVGLTQSFGAGNDDVWLIKTDANGNEIWSKTFGGSKGERGYCVRQTNDGGYIIAGYTMSFGAGGYDAWLIKTDANGNEIWNKTFGKERTDWGYSIQQTSDGGYIIAGYTMSFGAGKNDIC